MAMVVMVDQLAKWWAEGHVHVVYNQGVAFGLASGWWWAGVIAVLVEWIGWKKQTQWEWYLILGGGLSNLVDRLFRPGVVDFIWVFSWFPFFNIADFVITIGLIWLVLVQLLHGRAKDTV